MFPTIKLNIERWKYNPTFELYVSNMGHVRNKSKADIAPKIMQNGYVVIHVGGSAPHWMLLHRLVMLTWKPTPEAENLTVDHLDHNKRNNTLSNLEWVTEEENQRRATEDYLYESTLVGNDVIIRNKIAQPENKKKRKAADILGVVIRSEKRGMIPVFIGRKDETGLLNFCTPHIGKVNHFSTKGLREIVKNIYSGKNSSGYKKWCGFEILAAYPDNDFVEKKAEK